MDAKYEQRKKMIYDFMCDDMYVPMKIKELAIVLGVKKDQRPQLEQILNELMTEGRIVCSKRGKFSKSEEKKITGTFQAHPKGFGFVSVEGEKEDIFIPESETNGAMHMDTVEISVSPAVTGRRREGKVLHVLERGMKQVVCTYQLNKNFGFAVPDNPKFGSDIFIPLERSKGAVNGHKVVVEITQYGKKGKNPEGKVVEILGHINDPGVDILSIVRAYGLPVEFDPKVMTQVEHVAKPVSEADMAGRMDLRDWQMVTIDGEDAKDLDDAVSLTMDHENYILGVHIADVSNYVQEHSALDTEALKRGTSVYLVDRVIPMLPHALSNGICSLNQGEERLALSCIMTVNPKGEIIDHTITESVICVDRRMTYTNVKKILADHDPEVMAEYEPLVPMFEKMAELVRDKKIDGITSINDHSNREGMRICIELRRDANANVILNQLYKHTQLQDTFGVNMLALVNNEPKVMNLLDMLKYYLQHQEDVVTRRTKYDLNKAQERAHILEGLLKALENIDEVIRIIRASKNTQEAKEGLITAFGLTEVQAQAIVDMRLRALTGLERARLQGEYDELVNKIRELKAILGDRSLLLRVIRQEILLIAEKYGDDRRTSIGFDEYDLSMEDLIPKENTVIAMTKLGYIKRMTVDNFRSQNRGGKGIKGMATIHNDYMEELLMTTTHHYLMFFTNMGRVYRLKAYEIPEASRTARGTAIVNLLSLQAEEKITAVIPVNEFKAGEFLFMATRKGVVKKTPIEDYSNVRKTGLAAISLRDDDELIEVKFTDGKKDVILVTKFGQCIRFHESDVRQTGRVSMGVRGINLQDEDEVIGMQLSCQGDYLLIVSEKGMGKRTSVGEFTCQNRGGKGVKCYKITEKTGNVVGVKAVNEENEIMLITTEGIIIRLECKDISILGRITSGVKLMNLKNDITVASIAKVREKEEESEETEEETETAKE